MAKIDLHIHTNSSDGKYSFKEIIDMAVKNNVSTISITDHDTVDAYTLDNIEYAKEKNVNLIYGVEISTKTEKSGVHILGYNIDINNKELLDCLYTARNSRHIYLKEVSNVLTKLGYIVNYEKLDKIEAVTKAHIADDIVSNPLNHDKLMKVFGLIPDRGLFIETLMNEGEEAYVEKKTISPKEAGNIIRKACGKVVLAHPVAYEYEDNLTEEDIEKLINDSKADGVESYYIYVNKDNKVINAIKKWETFARKHKIFMTIGSDFHNDDGIRPIIGLINVINQEEYINSDNILNNLND